MEKIKTVRDSQTEQVHCVMQTNINGANRLFGGQLLAWIDEVAGIVGNRHAGGIVVTACIDNLQFKDGAYLGDIVVVMGKVTYVSNSSMEVRVDTYVEDLETGLRRPINRAYFVMVAVDENGKSFRVPRLKVETECEKAEWEGAIRRNQLRKERRIEGF